MLVVRTGSGFAKRRPSKPYVSTEIANLQRGRSLALERTKEEPGDWYIQVRMRHGNTFQLEYRDGVPSEHYMTLTISQEKGGCCRARLDEGRERLARAVRVGQHRFSACRWNRARFLPVGR